MNLIIENWNEFDQIEKLLCFLFGALMFAGFIECVKMFIGAGNHRDLNELLREEKLDRIANGLCYECEGTLHSSGLCLDCFAEQE